MIYVDIDSLSKNAVFWTPSDLWWIAPPGVTRKNWSNQASAHLCAERVASSTTTGACATGGWGGIGTVAARIHMSVMSCTALNWNFYWEVMFCRRAYHAIRMVTTTLFMYAASLEHIVVQLEEPRFPRPEATHGNAAPQECLHLIFDVADSLPMTGWLWSAWPPSWGEGGPQWWFIIYIYLR